MRSGQHRSRRTIGPAVEQFGHGRTGEKRRGALEHGPAQSRRRDDAEPPPKFGVPTKARSVGRNQKRGRAGFFLHPRNEKFWNWPAQRGQAVGIADEQPAGFDRRLKGNAEFLRNGPVERDLLDRA